MGAEGGNLTYQLISHVGLWNEGTMSRRDNGSAEFTPIAGGMADWGIGYALTSFNDTKNNRRVQYAWVQEDITGDLGLFSVNQQGFQGSHSLPRELFVHEVSGVVDDGETAENKNSVLVEEDGGTYLAQTLGVKPLAEVVEALRQGCYAARSYGSKTYSASKILQKSGSSDMELKVTVGSATGAVGVIIAASPDMSEYTTITYQPSNSTLLVERAHSSNFGDNVQTYTVTGYFHPYTISSGGEESSESITMDVFLDGSLVEIYVNDRFAMSTRIYPANSCSNGYGVYVEPGSKAAFESIEAWEDLLHIWPERPLDSSSPLVYDTPAETNNSVWWPGN